MKIIILILCASLKSAFSVKCYTCQSSSDESCDEQQKEIQCTQEEQCVTLKYSETNEVIGVDERVLNRVDKRIHKYCQNMKFSCDKECRAAFLTGQHTCKAECCDRDLCNKETAEKKVVKRNNNDARNNASSKLSTSANLYFSAMVAIIWIFKH